MRLEETFGAVVESWTRDLDGLPLGRLAACHMFGVEARSIGVRQFQVGLPPWVIWRM